MSITATHLTTSQNGSSFSTYTTGSITPTPGRLQLIAVASQITAGIVSTPTVAGCGLNWVSVASSLSSKGTLRRLTVFRALGSSTSTGALTIDFAGQAQLRCAWSVSEFDGILATGTDGSDAIYQAATHDTTDSLASTTLVVTLAAFNNVNNATYGAIRMGDSSNTRGLTAGAGFTQLGIQNGSASIQSQFNAQPDTTVDWTYSSALIYNEGIALELVDITGTPPPPPPPAPPSGTFRVASFRVPATTRNAATGRSMPVTSDPPCLYLDGNRDDQTIQPLDLSVLKISATDDYSVGAYVYLYAKTFTGSIDNHCLFSYDFNFGSNKGGAVYVHATNGALTAFSGNTSYTSSTGLFTYGAWHSVIFTISGTTLKGYIDGVLVWTQTIARVATGGNNNCFIGQEGVKFRKIFGFLKNVFIVRRLLDQSTITNIVAGTYPTVDLLHYVDENNAQAIHDYSGNLNHSVATNPIWIRTGGWPV